MTHLIHGYHISLVNVQANYSNNNFLILDVKQLNKIIKLYYFYTLKALGHGQGKIKMYYGLKSSYQEKGLLFLIFCIPKNKKYILLTFQNIIEIVTRRLFF